jgi:hypothetical protein
LPMRFRCEPIPRAAVRLVSPAMGPAKPGQGPVIRKVPKSTCRLAHRGGFFSVLLFPPLLCRSATPVRAFCSRVWARAGTQTAVLSSRTAVVRRDGSQVTEAVRGARHGDTTMRKSDDPALRTTTTISLAHCGPKATIFRLAAAASFSTTRVVRASAAIIASRSRLAALPPGCRSSTAAWWPLKCRTRANGGGRRKPKPAALRCSLLRSACHSGERLSRRRGGGVQHW